MDQTDFRLILFQRSSTADKNKMDRLLALENANLFDLISVDDEIPAQAAFLASRFPRPCPMFDDKQDFIVYDARRP